LDYWSEGCANYWGHNAIIRTETFIKYCALPKLPGRKPFGGHILSHDFVEAALMLKEGAHVWLAHGLEGSYEESPQGLIENAQRDRRWCQGNLQHTMLLFARGLRGVNRIHLLQGIFGYLSSPLWLIFLLTFYWIWMVKNISGLSNIAVHSWMSQLNLSAGQHALLIFMICISVLLIPRVLSILDAMFDLQRLRAFGGIIHICVSTVVETLFSTLHAPLQMLWHTQFVLTILMGKGVDWGRQTREADGTSWAYALRNQWWQTVLGLIWGGSLYYYAPEAFWWFLPICTGLVLAVPLSVFTSRRSWGAATCRLGLFLTPEETSPPPILSVLRMITAPGQKPEEPAEELLPAPNLIESIVDPYINAIHVSLLRENKLDPDAAEARARTMPEASQLRALAEKLLTQGFDALNGPERSVLLSDADTVSWLHRQVWLRSEATLASTWRAAMRRCGV
jgi:membrane glycosyltransferase